LEALCQSIAKEVQNELESTHRFVFIEQGNLEKVCLDEKLVAAILRNLLSNAFKYSNDGTEVTMRAEIKDRHCIISIADNGIGIPASDQQHLFETFFRGSNVGNIFGTGLGLTITEQCAKLHGGTISIESALNKGTTATITIPIMQ
jgi:signal transduction histidine kinase